MNCLFTVHNQLGSSLLEKYYQRALEKEFAKRKISFIREKEVKLLYDGEVIGKYFVDFIVDNKIVLELKAREKYSPRYFQQAYQYLKQLDLPLALLVNFRSDKISYKRIINPDCKKILIDKISD